MGTESIGGSGGSTSCRQCSHLLLGCWCLHQSSGIPPELGQGPAAFLELENRGSQDISWGLGSENWGTSVGRPVTHLFFQLVWVTLCAFSDY